MGFPLCTPLFFYHQLLLLSLPCVPYALLNSLVGGIFVGVVVILFVFGWDWLGYLAVALLCTTSYCCQFSVHSSDLFDSLFY